MAGAERASRASGVGAGVDRARLAAALSGEVELFATRHPASAERARQAGRHLLGGVPMPWMSRWPGPFPIHFVSAHGARFHDVDGIEYIDFCLGDTGAMSGHGLPEIAEALRRRALDGITTMLPTDDAAWVAEELARRFGLPIWQAAMTATDANRFVLRFARHLTGRPKVAVMDWCYHGTVDETLAILGADGSVIARPGAIGPQVDVAQTTRVVPFNDAAALDEALAHGDVACLLMEPALTNIGIVLPDPGYLDEVREITGRHGVLWILDETHTICAGPGGAVREWSLEPDMFVIGKPIGGGVPCAAYGMSAQIAARLESTLTEGTVDVSGVGGTLTGNALALSAMRAALSCTLRDEDFAVAIPRATRWAEGVRAAYERHGLSWHVQQLGCRAEYWFSPPPRNGRDAAAAIDGDLDAFMHLFALNRGILLTPFHNMALLSPHHSVADVDRHTEVFAEALAAIVEPE